MATRFEWPEPGERFGRLTVIESHLRYPPSLSQVRKNRPGARAVRVQCDCRPETYTVTLANLHHGIWPTRSCRHCAGRDRNIARGRSGDDEFNRVLARARKRAWRAGRKSTVDDLIHYIRTFEEAS